MIFGEWLTYNGIVYKPENINKWYVFDIYDRKGDICPNSSAINLKKNGDVEAGEVWMELEGKS